jgi:CPA1 family monovalent cation:H+ antiporter
MPLMQALAVFLVLITVIGWLNVRFFRLPTSVAMLGAGLISAVALLVAQTTIAAFWGFNTVSGLLKTMNFSQAVLDYMLGFLLFASGLQVDLSEMRKRRVAVWSLATIGVLLSTALVGLGVWAAARAIGADLPLAWAFTFGALISPTDPISVLSAMRTGAVSPRLGAVLQGEALFNDGVGLVAFTAALAFATSGLVPHPLHEAGAIVLEAGGGLVLGLACAFGVAIALRPIDDWVVEVTATIALAVGVYVAAGLLHLSGPIASAAAGLVIGDYGVKTAMSEQTRRYVEAFWELTDQILNAMLFLLLSLQVFVLPFDVAEMGLWATATGLALIARLLVVLPWGAFFHFRHEERGASLILTWGGLRGAISLALALSLPHGPYRDTLLAMTFIVVIFSVVVQGLTFAPLARRLGKTRA